jgi:hypothetical protein
LQRLSARHPAESPVQPPVFDEPATGEPSHAAKLEGSSRALANVHGVEGTRKGEDDLKTRIDVALELSRAHFGWREDETGVDEAVPIEWTRSSTSLGTANEMQRSPQATVMRRARPASNGARQTRTGGRTLLQHGVSSRFASAPQAGLADGTSGIRSDGLARRNDVVVPRTARAAVVTPPTADSFGCGSGRGLRNRWLRASAPPGRISLTGIELDDSPPRRPDEKLGSRSRSAPSIGCHASDSFQQW